MVVEKDSSDLFKDSTNLDKAEQKNLKKPSSKRFHNDKLMLSTLAIATIITFLLYTVPDWVFYEIPTRDIISILLDFFGVFHTLIPTVDPNSIIPETLRGGSFPFLEATIQTPGIHIPSTNGDYWIVKACTGMQAGSLLIAIIMVTEATWKAKIKASMVFFFSLFIGNALRITFHLLCVYILVNTFEMDPETAFYWAHDVSSKVIGFFGTILFAIIIERMGVPIIDQFADWLDYMWWRGNKIIESII
ncbi:MAG: exosortase/archaeosortase family protein [Candidatus Heimdallarchaeota archaeon]|nr:exosortase/archaeosortase family protein [Candidatus Heimdallarchaeota archaeon]